MDLGAGDGRFALAHARTSPNRLVLAVDANADRMIEASRRASRPTARGGLQNVLFAVAALEALPVAFNGLADLVTVHFPWGSLRSAAIGAGGAGAGRIAALVRPGGTLSMLVADAEHDGAPLLDPASVRAAYASLGLSIVEDRPAGLDDAVAVHSSWGKRLLRNPSAGRSARAFRLKRPGLGPADGG